MLLNLLLLPLSVVATPTVPELTSSDWNSIQSGFIDSARSLGSWSWNKAEEIVQTYEDVKTADDESLTIWQQLKADTDTFSKLVKIIEFEGKAEKYLDDKDSQITFFAPNNEALTPPEQHKHHDHDDVLNDLIATPSLASLSSILESTPSLLSKDDGKDDDEKKRRKEIFRFIAGKVLQYHGLTKAYTAQEIAQNSTIPTALKADDGSYGGLHRRIRISKSLVPPSVKINFYAKVVSADQKARNGYLHTLDHPLFPPGDILEELFLFPDHFSTLTSSIQKVGGEKFYTWKYDRENSKPGKPAFNGTALATTFDPTNAAFALLPPRLKFYLFSPFGEKALAKVLMYHYVPKTLLLSELVYTEKEGKVDFSDLVESHDFNMFDETYHKEFTVHTALPNSTLSIVVNKSKILPIEGATRISVKVNGQPVEVIDVPARNGASHVIGKLLVPPHHHHDHKGEDISSDDSWENWEEWLPAFAQE